MVETSKDGHAGRKRCNQVGVVWYGVEERLRFVVENSRGRRKGGSKTHLAVVIKGDNCQSRAFWGWLAFQDNWPITANCSANSELKYLWVFKG